MKRIFMVSGLVVFLAAQAFSQDAQERIRIVDHSKEWWRCYDVSDYSQEKNLVKLFGLIATTKEGESISNASVEFAGIRHSAVFKVIGLNRRWDFVLEEGFYTYAFEIIPNGTGSYYDFTGQEGKVEPSQVFKCDLVNAYP